MRFRPCIDLLNGKVVQIVGSTLQADRPGEPDTNFVTERSPAYFARIYSQDRLFGGHLICLGPGNRQAALSAL